jgi:CheY-like chemotaxis protein
MPRILVADDDGDIRDLVTFKLVQAGHEVHAFDNGEDALNDAFTTTPDVAVLDVMMP